MGSKPGDQTINLTNNKAGFNNQIRLLTIITFSMPPALSWLGSNPLEGLVETTEKESLPRITVSHTLKVYLIYNLKFVLNH